MAPGAWPQSCSTAGQFRGGLTRWWQRLREVRFKGSTITANINQYLDVPLPAPREGSARDSVGQWVEAEDLHCR